MNVMEYPAAGRPPLVLLHGIGSRAVSWWPVIDGLAPHFHLVALDLRGHGGSMKPGRGYLLPEYAADLAAVIAALELARPFVLGHSLGALATLTWAIANPGRAAAIVLEDPPLRTEAAVLQAFDEWLALAALSPAAAAAYYRREHPDWTEEECERRAASITATTSAVFHEMRAEAAANLAAGRDRFGQLERIQAPTLLVHGDRDLGSMVLPEDAARFVETLPDARLARVADSGHNIHQAQPAAFLAAVVPFLTGAASQTFGVSGGM